MDQDKVKPGIVPDEIPNNKEEVPLQHYLEEFAKINPAERAEAVDTAYVGGEFYIKMLNTPYCVTWPKGKVSAVDMNAVAIKRIPGQIFLLRYLMEGKKVTPKGEWKTFREMPWGEVYIKPFTGRCLTRAAYKFGTNVKGFKKGAEALGGIPVKHGDAGYQFEFIGNYSIQIFVWEGDDEFAPNAQILYSDNFEDGFSAEDRVVAAELLITAIGDRMNG